MKRQTDFTTTLVRPRWLNGRLPGALQKQALRASERPGIRGGVGRLVAVVAILTTASSSGCSSPGATDAERSTAGVARTQVDRGLVRVSVEMTPEPARLSDEPTLTLTIDHEQGIEIEKPPFGEAVGQFIIRDFREPLPETRGTREIIRQIYTLEPTATGSLQIDPISISFTDARPNGDGKEHTVQTEALTLNVLSIVEADAPSLDDLEGLAPPVTLPPSRAWMWWLAAGLGIAVGMAAGVAVFLRQRRRTIEAVQLSPREIAERALDELWSNQAKRCDVKIFYVELTAVVRRYIEGTTGVHAPEQTTEEFLREIGGDRVFSLEERQRLKEFLESADLVKFAAHRPQLADIKQSYRRARRFVAAAEQQEAAA